MSIVSQTPSLFNDTIMENIAYSSDSFSLAQVENAAKVSNCMEFIAKFRSGMNTLVGGRGLSLSGGQRQRIAIARAAMVDPDILILDEATSALDAKNESQVKHALDELMKDKTVIVIAHRLSTIINADQIICLKDGEIQEVGNHRELIQNKGFYYNLIEKQLQTNTAINKSKSIKILQKLSYDKENEEDKEKEENEDSDGEYDEFLNEFRINDLEHDTK